MGYARRVALDAAPGTQAGFVRREVTVQTRAAEGCGRSAGERLKREVR